MIARSDSSAVTARGLYIARSADQSVEIAWFVDRGPARRTRYRVGPSAVARESRLALVAMLHVDEPQPRVVLHAVAGTP
jgi:hypothetical protein